MWPLVMTLKNMRMIWLRSSELFVESDTCEVWVEGSGLWVEGYGLEFGFHADHTSDHAPLHRNPSKHDPDP